MDSLLMSSIDSLTQSQRLIDALTHGVLAFQSLITPIKALVDHHINKI